MATAVALPPALESNSTTSPIAEPINKHKSYWTPERRAELAEKMHKVQQAKRAAREQEEVEDAEETESSQSTLSPFALTDEHEFPTFSPSVKSLSPSLPPRPDPVAVAVEPPALPGTPASLYRHCPCLGVMPGRVCTFCYGTKWMKICSRCEGEGRIQLSVRKGAERSQPCGHCGGKGTLPANQKEIAEATLLVEEWAAGQDGQAVSIAEESPEFRRAVKLPGIGVTTSKRGGTLAARRRDRERNEKRKQKRVAGKTAAN
jgi:hypothetical protein